MHEKSFAACRLGLSLLFFAFGCSQQGGVTPGNELKDSVTKAAAPVIKDTMHVSATDTTILLNGDEAFIRGHIIANKTQPSYILAGSKGQSVTAIVKPVEKGGNVRINQIQQPGGAYDGPFGDSLVYEFKRNGNIRFIIGENQMAGDPYTGDFTLHIILK